MVDCVQMCPAVMLSVDDISLPSGVPIIVAHGTQGARIDLH
jgi:hypothetical protein